VPGTGGGLRGPLVLVVGPSGAGKDSIIEGAAARLCGDEEFVFVRRLITRPAALGGEAHVALTTEEFALRRERGDFVLHWQAHGLDYGIPATIEEDRAAGRTVIVNVSRAVIGEARASLSPIRVVQIVARGELLAARLAVRGRESAMDIRQRLDRAAAIEPAGDVTTIRNDGPLDGAVDQFILLLREITGQRLVVPTRR
jgi:ribose 1,5-bisphosphokinase